MCRLFAGIATENYSWRHELDAFAKLADSGLRAPHSDGWGIGFFLEPLASPAGKGTASSASAQVENLHVEKAPYPATADPRFKKTAEKAISRICIAHVRKASCGANTYENSQPFSVEGLIFAHNGELDYQKTKSLLSEEYASKITGQSDSELYALLVAQEIERAGDTLAGIKNALSKIFESGALKTSLNFVMSDGEYVYALSYATEEVLKKRREEALRGKRGMEYYYNLYFTRLTNPNRLLICSEKLPMLAPDADWYMLNNGDLLTVDACVATSIEGISGIIISNGAKRNQLHR